MRVRNRVSVRCIVGTLAVVLIVIPLLARDTGSADAAAHANQAFARTWARTDRAVADGTAPRTWMWGPEPFSGAVTEEYAQAPDGRRLVQYYDKSRMEITQPDADQTQRWYVSNGLLARELITGQLQTGDAQFTSRAPASINVAGDPDTNVGATYASFSNLLGVPPQAVGSQIAQSIQRDGTVINRPLDTLTWSATVGAYVAETNHSIAQPFVEFFDRQGPLWIDEQYVTGQVAGVYETGFPITEPYWSEARVGGTVTIVLVQCFERRCLTWTPGNAPEWQVEMGNVGRHYFQWRYPDAPGTPTPTVHIPGTPTATPANCDPSYPDFCIPPPPPDLNCSDIGQTNLTVLQPDPHNLDPDNDGIGCEGTASTSTSTRTSTVTATATRTVTATATGTPTPTRTPTLMPTATATATQTSTSTPTAAPTNTPTGGPEDRCLSTQEYQFLLLINAYRLDNGLGALSNATKLNIASYRHSLDMGTRDYFAHDTQLPLPPGQSGPAPTDRMAAAGYTNYSSAGENIAAGFSTAQAAFDVWRDSAPHNAAMLNPTFTQIGIGLVSVPGSTYNYYWTTDFANGNDGAPGC